MSTSQLVVAVDTADPRALAGFWAALLGRRAQQLADGWLVTGAHPELDLLCVASPDLAPEQHTTHLHLTSESAEHQRETVARVLALGGRHLDVGQQEDEGHVVVADLDGNALCVIEPGNSYLAGCGLLAEVACDGGRDVGLFWSQVTGWPFVWDSGDETAVQSPAGGTKVAWGGASPGTPDPCRLHLELLCTDVPEQAARLLALGATLLGPDATGATRLLDPGGHELRVRSS